ncbi:hypothetical protein QNI19_02705 [Cytophagaceae bacterium DM2B3-1]|uniref:Uncharacterized protein n=1 Tax=Xanthocytophaga flava TaxID=3048013 RepID=A0ABT7CFQ9_9BACT|nr:hypothetical protein [Xanthocytophaga flavus]MDJ1491825.1 hypothetical protein [Xanthocytophaga flavus]
MVYKSQAGFVGTRANTWVRPYIAGLSKTFALGMWAGASPAPTWVRHNPNCSDGNVWVIGRSPLHGIGMLQTRFIGLG